MGGQGRHQKYQKNPPYRIESKCKFFPQCDGCQLQNLDYNKQLELKRNMVENNLKRIGKIENVVVKDTIGMDYPFRYRNKAEFKVGKKIIKQAIIKEKPMKLYLWTNLLFKMKLQMIY